MRRRKGRQFTWIKRAAEIVVALENKSGLVDRGDVEKLFGTPGAPLSKDAALYLMEAAGAVVKGKSYVIDAKDLHDFVVGAVQGVRTHGTVILAPRTPPQDTFAFVQRGRGFVAIPATTGREFLLNMHRAAQAAQDPIQREKLFAHLGLKK